MKKLSIIFALLLTCLSVNAGSVKIDAAHFPDASFRSEVLWFDKTYGNNNGYLDDAESSQIVLAGHTTTATSIRINSACAASDGTTDSDIHDLTGIKYFTNLKKFGTGEFGQVEFNPSADYTIDLSGMTNLEEVYIQNPMNSHLLHLNLKNCTALKKLAISVECNPIDFDVTGCKNLETIIKQQCQHANSGSSFSISAPAADFPKLTKIYLNNNYYLQNVNINVGALKDLTISNCNTLTGENLTIGGNTNLESLNLCNNAKLSNITFDLNNFSKLTKLNLSGNKLGGKSFNISKLPVLLSDGESYFGNQASSGVVNVTMTTAQYANFLADNTNNKNVNVTTVEPEVDVTKYNIWVKGIQITDANKDDVLGDGTVKFYSNFNYLYLTNANITASGTGSTEKERACLYFNQAVTVVVLGTNTLTGNGDYAPIVEYGGFSTKFSTTQYSGTTANLIVNSTTTAMKFYGSNTTEFKHINVTVTGGSYGIWGEKGTLGLTDCDMSVTGSSSVAPIYGFGTITTSGTSLTSPSDLTYDTTSRYYKQNGSLYKGTIVFGAEYYGITVDGIKVTSRTNENILGDNSRTVIYDTSTKTLILSNATISTSQSSGILIESDANIRLIGTNKISATGKYGAILDIEKGYTSTISSNDGTGVLDLSSPLRNVALYDEGTLTISNCTVNAITSGTYGIAGDGAGTVTIQDGATVTAQGTEASVSYLASLNLNGVEITSPSGAKFYKGSVVDTYGNIVTDKVTIKCVVYEHISVGGHQVTSLNCNDILGDGTMSYDDATKTITMNNAKIDNIDEMDDGLVLDIDDFTLKLVGTNTISGYLWGIYLYKNVKLTITSDDGTGTLNIENCDISGIDAKFSTLIIKDCNVNINGGLFGGSDFDNKTSSLLIDNANVTVNGNNVDIQYWNSIQLNNAYIASPADAEIEDGSIVINGEVVKGQDVVIKAGSAPDAINDITADDYANGKVYNTTGAVVTNGYKGIAIKNGKKYLVK